MIDNVYNNLLLAYESLNYISDLLSQKGFIIHDEGVLEIKKIRSPNEFKAVLTNEIDNFLNKLDTLSFFFVDEQLGGLKSLAYKRIKNIKLITQNKIINPHFTPKHIVTYNLYREAQRDLRRHFLTLLDEERIYNIKSSKFTWLGSQRQLIELFDTLKCNGWIDFEEFAQEKQCLPIIEMFNIKKEEKIQKINIESFNKAWKSDGDNRNPQNYKEIFQILPKNPRSSKS